MTHGRTNAIMLPHVIQNNLHKMVAGGMKQARLFVPNPRDLAEEDVSAIY
jgi:alcohol dehydrogenase class IV